MMKKIVCIYKCTNLINNKIYIGRTNDYYRRIREHKSHAKKDGGNFHEDIINYGFDSFEFSIIEECKNSELDDKEKYYISLFKKKYGESNIYNICKGGLGGETHDINGCNNPMYGTHKTDEEKKHLSAVLKGKKKPDDFGEKLSKLLKGKPKSPSAVAKRSTPMKVINIYTNEILSFSSKNEMARTLHCDSKTIDKGHITHNGYKKYEEDVETIETL